MGGAAPGKTCYFSIVIPVFNREREILRAVNSCLQQSFRDLEVVVVDDASSDGTTAALGALAEPRLVLRRHRENRGVCPARNTGLDACRGQWVLFLDSDDELLPEALARIHGYTEGCPGDIERLGFLYRRDDGRLSPEPAPADSVLGYEAYLRLSAQWQPSDFFHCTRRRAFRRIRFPDSRAYEASYLLDFARAYRTRMIPAVVARVHMDSLNRESNLSCGQRVQRLLAQARDQCQATDGLLARHRDALGRQVPQRLQMYRKAQLLFCLLAGCRRAGVRLAAAYLRAYPLCPAGWIILLAGLADRRLLAWVQVWKNRGV